MKMRNLIKTIFISLLFLVAIISCSNDDNTNDTPETAFRIVAVDPDPGEIIPEDEMKAVFLYDGILKSIDSKNKLKVLQDAETVVKLSDKFIIDNEVKSKIDGKTLFSLPVSVVKACYYGGKLFFYGIDNKLYIENDDKFTIIGSNPNGYPVALNSDGVAIGFRFYNSDGSFQDGTSEFSFIVSNKIVGIKTFNGNKEKYLHINDEWVRISTGLYSDFFKYDALITDEKVIWCMGATLDLESMQAVEPTYNVGLGEFIGGNAFVNYFEKSKEKIWKPIGYIENTGYFLRPFNGKIYKYDIVLDTLTEWVKIVDGTDNDDKNPNQELIEKTGAIICGEDIIYFDGSRIQRINLETGVNAEIAEATEFKGICL